MSLILPNNFLLALTNTLAFYVMEFITPVKIFMIQAQAIHFYGHNKLERSALSVTSTPGLIFAGKVGAYQSGAALQNSSLVVGSHPCLKILD